MEFIESLKGSFPRLQTELQRIQDFYSRKLWHQLCVEIEQIVKTAEFQNEDVASGFYANFIAGLDLKFNALSLAKIVNTLANTCKDHDRAIEFLNTVSNKVESSKEAWAYLKSSIASHLILKDDLKVAQETIDDAKKAIDEAGTVDNIVNSVFYKAHALHLQRSGKSGEFYRTALLYLAYTPAEEIPIVEQQAVAFDLGIAALISDSVYNFGELLAHPAVETLAGSNSEWLLHLLKVFNRGDIHKYEELVNTFQSALASQPSLLSHSEFMKEKIRLMSVMELVFIQGSGSRVLSFADVQSHTGVNSNEVEVLLLKALALGLIKGRIDEVDKQIEVTWVQPRVLDVSQIASIRENIGKWIEKVDKTLVFIESETPELFA